MPHYPSWGANAQHLSRLPPTPPEYQTAYQTPMSTSSEQGFYPIRTYHGRQTSSRDHGERYFQNPAYTVQHTSHAHPRVNHHMTYDGYAQGMQAFEYGAQGPVLPPIRASGAIDPYNYPQEKKEEKPTGGVAQHLDYDMDVMICFVADMIHKIVVPGTEPTREFRKYVSQILSSTRLPSSTIMLGLFLLHKRMQMVKELGHDVSQKGMIYRMLTTCLVLGSKFLDDNTFQNKSWAEVSSIPVMDLNIMELDWLQGFNWELRRLMYDTTDGYFLWLDHWRAYDKKAKATKAKEMQKLAPIQTKLASRYMLQHSALMSPDGPIPPQYQQQGSQFDAPWTSRYVPDYSPPSAPHSDPATPEYYHDQWSYATPGFSRQGYNNFGVQSGFQQPPAYQPYYNQAWTGHGHSCGCNMCGKQQADYYYTPDGYSIPAVVG